MGLAVRLLHLLPLRGRLGACARSLVGPVNASTSRRCYAQAYIWINFGVGIDPKLEPRCSPEEADYLVDKLDKGKEKPKPVLTLAVWLAVAKQPVVWGMALCTVIKGFGEPVFLT